MSGWDTIKEYDYNKPWVNVVPRDDLKPHVESSTCMCKPRIEKYRNGVMVIHNAYDGREEFIPFSDYHEA